MTEPAEMTLDELREALAPLIPAHAAFDGWPDNALASAAEQLAVPADRARLAFPDGALQMIDSWFDSIDRSMVKAWSPERIASLKMRERIRALVFYRVELINPNKEALRRAFAILAQPQNAMATARFAWRAADRMWRLAGDSATDFSHYSKRGILAALYTATMLVFLDDSSEGMAETQGFLDRRIDDVMRIERLKAQWRGSGERLPSLSRFLGRLRYPAV
jgi:ubiquinone biosynthesis protein COQ9